MGARWGDETEGLGGDFDVGIDGIDCDGVAGPEGFGFAAVEGSVLAVLAHDEEGSRVDPEEGRGTGKEMGREGRGFVGDGEDVEGVFVAKDLGFADAGSDGGEQEGFVTAGEGKLGAKVVEGTRDIGGENREIARAWEAREDLIAIGDLEQSVAAGGFVAEFIRGLVLETDLLSGGLTGAFVA